MVKIELTIIDLIFTMVHVHQAKSMWLRHCLWAEGAAGIAVVVAGHELSRTWSELAH